MENPNQTPKKNSNVIYFLIVVVIALLGTDVYLYFRKNNDEARIVTQTEEKTKLQTDKTRLQSELDSLETQIEQVNAGKTKLSAEMQAKNDSLSSRIKELRHQLSAGKLTAMELQKAQEDMKQLRYFVTKYTADIDELKKQNQVLKDTLTTTKTTLATVSEKATTLEKQNQDLNTKVQVASALKIANINVTPLKVKSSGKERDVKRAGATKKIRIDFTIPVNPIAEKRMHEIFVRITDPTGNLITGTETANFQADGQELQYTYKSAIDFKDDGSGYSIDWVNPNPFQKGTYTIVLYADGYTMGTTTFVLK
jgi:predicted nuclease with TOPRIM domain